MAVCGKDKLLVYKYIIFNAVCTGLVNARDCINVFLHSVVENSVIYFENSV